MRGGGSLLNIPPPSVTYVGTTDSTANATSYAMNNVSMGDGDHSMYIIAAVQSRWATTQGSFTFSVNGLLLPAVISTNGGGLSHGFGGHFIFPYPGPRADFTIATTQNGAWMRLGIYRAVLVGAYPVGTAVDQGATVSTTVPTINGGRVIVSTGGASAAAGATGFTFDSSLDVDGDGNGIGSGSTSGAVTTISVTGGSNNDWMVVSSWG